MFAPKPQIFDRVDMRFLSWILSAIVITFYVLSLVGCLSTSPGIPNLFLIQLQTNQSQPMQVRIGYFGICASQPLRDDLRCLPSSSLGQNQVKDAFLNSTMNSDGNYDSEMEPLLEAAYIFQTKIFSPLLAASAAMFFVSIISMLFIKRSMKQLVPAPPSNVAYYTRSILSVTMLYAFGLALAAAYSTTQAANALNFTTTVLSGSTPQLEILPGGPIQGLQWTIVGLLVLIQWSVAGMFPRPPPPPRPLVGALPPPTLPYMMPPAPEPVPAPAAVPVLAPAFPAAMPPVPPPAPAMVPAPAIPMGVVPAPPAPMGMLPAPAPPMGIPQPPAQPMAMLPPPQAPM